MESSQPSTCVHLVCPSGHLRGPHDLWSHVQDNRWSHLHDKKTFGPMFMKLFKGPMHAYLSEVHCQSWNLLDLLTMPARHLRPYGSQDLKENS